RNLLGGQRGSRRWPDSVYVATATSAPATTAARLALGWAGLAGDSEMKTARGDEPRAYFGLPSREGRRPREEPPAGRGARGRSSQSAPSAAATGGGAALRLLARLPGARRHGGAESGYDASRSARARTAANSRSVNGLVRTA